MNYSFFHWKFLTFSILCLSFFSTNTFGTSLPPNTRQESTFLRSSPTLSNTEIEVLEIVNSNIFSTFREYISPSTNPLSRHALVTNGHPGASPSLQVIKLLVKLDSSKSAAFIMGPTSPTTDIPNTIVPVEPLDKVRFPSGYAFPGFRLDINRSTLAVNFFGVHDSFNRTLPPQPKSVTRNVFSIAAIQHRSSIHTLPKRYLIDQVSQPIAMSQTAAAVLMTAYIFRTPNTSVHNQVAGNIVLTFNEAITNAKHNIISIGKALLDEPFIFEMDNYWLEQWQTFPIQAIEPSIFHGFTEPVTRQPQPPLTYHPWWPQTWSLIAHQTRVNRNASTYHRDNASILYMAEILPTQKIFSMSPPNALGWWLPDTMHWIWGKTKCLVNGTIGILVGTQTWCSDRLERFARARAATAGAQIQFISTRAPTPPPNVSTTTLVHVEELPLYLSRNAAESAIARLVCQVDGLGCTAEEYETIRNVSNLTINEMGQIRSAISACLDTPHCPDVDPTLPPLENITPQIRQRMVYAQAILDAGLNIANATGLNTEQNRNKKLQQPGTTLAAAHCLSREAGPSGSNTIESPEAEQDCFRAVQNKKRGNLVVLPPLLQNGGNFYLRPTSGSPSGNYDNLIRVVRNTDLIPPGFNRENFAHAIYAIGRDGAHAGENRGIFYLSDATFSSPQAGNTRFRYGISHIMAPGSGGGENQGHREDWARLGVTNDFLGRRRLAQIIMTALTSSIQPAISPRPASYYTFSRTYPAITVQETRQQYTNIRIVFGTNGNIITAFPLMGAKVFRIRDEF